MRTLLTALAVSVLSPTLAHPPVTEKLGPSQAVAHQRGPEIFNAVHNAMRQWGSSLHHNGMSFFLATVPEGVLFHHGNSREESPTDPDWLAYEIEHAEGFARGGRRGPGRGPPPRKYKPWENLQLGLTNKESRQHIIDNGSSPGPRDGEPGWLHVYRTTRPLRFLYVDGMGGGKTSLGTLDSQDYLLRGQRTSTEEEPGAKRVVGGGPMGERQRAVDLCKLCENWQLQGVIRMEAGFEIIKCNFSDGLEQIQVLQRPDSGNNGPPRRGALGNLELLRGLSERYHDIGSTRTIVDYSSMVSVFFFPVNLTNPDPKRPDLPRLSSTSDAELAAIKTYLTAVIEERRGAPLSGLDWQDITDIIVSRYADRLKFMAEKVDSVETMRDEIRFLLDVFIDYSGKEKDPGIPAAVERCTNFYLRSVTPATKADRLIYTALESVTSQICSTLFRLRELLVTNPNPDESSVAASVDALRSLMDSLKWTRFKRCPPCAIDEVCLIPMWPFGTVEEYNTPRCTNGSDTRSGENYWGDFRGGPDGPHDSRGP